MARPVVVAFNRLGPYHEARLRAAARNLPVLALQGCSLDSTYQWERVVPGGDYPVRTLYEAGDCERQPAASVRQKVTAALSGLDPAVVVVPGWSTRLALSCLDWCHTAGCPAVLLSDSTAWDEPRLKAKEWVKGKIISRFESALVAGQPHADYVAQLGMDRGRVFLGYDVVDNDHFAAKAEESRKQKAESRGEKAESRKQKAESGNSELPSPISELPSRYFLASARFVEKKNLSRLLAAYARYREKAESRKQKAEIWSLVLLGDGPLKADLCFQLSSFSFRDHVLLPGFKQYDELPAYYGLASAFIHASTAEQWGLVVNEAMASGLPVLVSNRCGCARDLVREGVNGFTFDPYDVEALAELMLKVSAFNFQLSALGDASRRIIADWGPERFVSGLKAAVELALQNPRPRAGLVDRVLLRALLAR